MPSSVTSLFWIMVCGAVAPLIAGMIPRRLVPEVVLLLIGGVVIGPFALELAAIDESISLLRELGLGMLFLLAGYELELSELTGRAGRRALGTWIVSLSLALSAVALVGLTGVIHDEVALAIAMTSTALGTLLPILRDTGLLSTPLGAAILRHGAWGELGPVIAIAVLLGSRGPIASLLLLVVFALLAVFVAVAPTRIRREGSHILQLIRAGSETTGQTTVRLTLVLLVALTAIATAFQLDSVLAAFAAGFILRRALPGGDERLESKLDGLAFGFLIPVFFVASGMAIDPGAVASEPIDLVLFVMMILLMRGGPIYFETRQGLDSPTSGLSQYDSLRVALYGATGLPIIVAVTAVAVSAGEMSSTNASVLVAGGAITVLLFPMIATAMGMRGPPSDQTSPPRRDAEPLTE